VRLHGRYSTVFVVRNEGGMGRLGIAATRKLGGAVVRNRAKRLIREVFRRNKLAPGFDVVVIPKRELLDASLTAVEADYRAIINRHMGRAGRAGRDSRV
jgi:ribonuclease P protein component